MEDQRARSGSWSWVVIFFWCRELELMELEEGGSSLKIGDAGSMREGCRTVGLGDVPARSGPGCGGWSVSGHCIIKNFGLVGIQILAREKALPPRDFTAMFLCPRPEVGDKKQEL